MIRFALYASTASILLASAAQAADAVVYQDVPVPQAVVTEQRLKGAFEVGGWANDFEQSDDDESDTPLGVYASTFAHVALTPLFILGIDAQAEFLDIGEDEDFDDFTPTMAAVVGSSLNYRAGIGSVGVFGGVGTTNGNDGGGVFGWLGGVQGAFDMGSTTLFGQVGYADIRVDEDDSGFSGPFGRIGLIHGFNEAFALQADAGYGESDDYEDEGDEGTYWTAGLKGAFRFSPDLPLVGTAGYEYRKYEANTEDDASEHSFRLGLSIPFGGSTTAKDVLNPFQTPIAPFRAAAYGEVLD